VVIASVSAPTSAPPKMTFRMVLSLDQEMRSGRGWGAP
jgi:hypothetical protein